MIYRADFPVFRYESINIYMIEGVIATIEVKSNLKTGNPSELAKSISNVASVFSLTNTAIMKKGTPENARKLQRIHSAKPFVIGYKGWSSESAFTEKYVQVLNQFGIANCPLAVYQPGFCAIRADAAPFYTTNQTVTPIEQVAVGIVSDNAFAMFLQNILRAVMERVTIIASHPEIDALMYFGLNNYLSIPDIKISRYISIQPQN